MIERMETYRCPGRCVGRDDEETVGLALTLTKGDGLRPDHIVIMTAAVLRRDDAREFARWLVEKCGDAE